MHDPREALMAAIRDYADAMQHTPSARVLIEQLQEIEQDISGLPTPVSQGPGSVPTLKPGGSGERDEVPQSVKELAVSALQNAHGER